MANEVEFRKTEMWRKLIELHLIMTSGVREVPKEDLDKACADMNENANLVLDLGYDDLDSIEYIMDIEEAFDVKIDEKDAERMMTLMDCYNVVKEKKEAVNA